MEIQLKPCPFCGSDNVHLFPGYFNYADHIVCKNCKAHFQTDEYLTDEELSEAWNKRAERKGHWIYVEHETPSNWSYRCTNCSRLSGDPSEYCPYCGASMDGEASK